MGGKKTTDSRKQTVADARDELLEMIKSELTDSIAGRDPRQLLRQAREHDAWLSKSLRQLLISLATRNQLLTVLPEVIKLTLGGQDYEAPRIIRQGKPIKGSKLIQRAGRDKALSDEAHGKKFLEHQEDIPTALRGKITFVFLEWRNAAGDVACVSWIDDREAWGLRWVSPTSYWYSGERPVRIC